MSAFVRMLSNLLMGLALLCVIAIALLLIYQFISWLGTRTWQEISFRQILILIGYAQAQELAATGGIIGELLRLWAAFWFIALGGLLALASRIAALAADSLERRFDRRALQRIVSRRSRR